MRVRMLNDGPTPCPVREIAVGEGFLDGAETYIRIDATPLVGDGDGDVYAVSIDQFGGVLGWLDPSTTVLPVRITVEVSHENQ